MRDFFASVRYFLSYVELERMNIGTIVHRFINKEIIPELQRKRDSAKTETEASHIDALIEEYRVYGDPRKPESKIYDRTAANNVRMLAGRSGLNDSDMEDLMQQLALDFFQPVTGGTQVLMDVLRKFRIEEGPLKLNSLWVNTVSLRTQYHIREIKRKVEQTLRLNENDDGEEVNPIDNLVAPSEVDWNHAGEMMDDLYHYVAPKLSRDVFKKMFDMWYEVVKEKGAGIELDRDLYKPLQSEWDIGRSTLFDMWKQKISPHIINFFRQELGDKFVPQIRRTLKLGSVDAITYCCYRQKMAMWVLGGMLRTRIESGE